MKFKVLLPRLVLAFILILPASSITQTRDPNKVYKVAILPFMIHSQENLDYLREGINDILTSRITVEERVVVIDRSIVERAFYEEKPMRLDEAAAAKIGTRIGADYVVFGSITKIGDYISLDARLISITEEKPPVTVYTQQKGIDDVMVKIGDFAQDIGFKILGRRTAIGRPGEPKGSSKGGIERFERASVNYKKSQTFRFEIKGLDIGDVDGDKKNELVVMDRHNLYIFKYDGEKMSLFKKIEAGDENNFLTLDVADLNRNGHAEIIVTSVVEDDVRSFILEYEEGKFKKITEKSNWFFRVWETLKEGPILLGQQRGSDGLPVDPVYRMVWKKNSFEKGPKMELPKGTNIFGSVMANVRGNGKPEVISLDRFDRLNIISEKGKTLWNSSDKFGGTSNFYETKKKWRDQEYKERFPWRVYIPGRVLIKDLEGDGTPQVIVNKNEPWTRLSEKAKVFEKGEIQGLIWEESQLATSWKTRAFNGYIPDFQVKDVDNDGNEELVFAVVTADDTEEGITGLLSDKKISNIYFFKLY
ncbi:MAG TPA: FG-GAP-like repeat-containing protein [Thermodesulfobacteriota bacterium]|nr:FG-GAP-like repeat-containing protein [Thermodesulfobacteriota bacterium]